MSAMKAGSTFVHSLRKGAEEVKKNLKEAFEEDDGINDGNQKEEGSDGADVEAEEEAEEENEKSENGGNNGDGSENGNIDNEEMEEENGNDNIDKEEMEEENGRKKERTQAMVKKMWETTTTKENLFQLVRVICKKNYAEAKNKIGIRPTRDGPEGKTNYNPKDLKLMLKRVHNVDSEVIFINCKRDEKSAFKCKNCPKEIDWESFMDIKTVPWGHPSENKERTYLTFYLGTNNISSNLKEHGGMEEADDVGTSRSTTTRKEITNNKNNKNDHASTESIAFVSDPNDLEEYIFRDEVQLAVWRRSKLPVFVQTLSESPALDHPSCLPTFLGKVTPSTVVDLMSKKLLPTTDDGDTSYCLSKPLIKELVADIERLVTIFATIIDNDEVHVKLEATNDNGCCFWHQDTVPLRMVTTYRGPTTEYVHPNVSQQILQQRQYNAPQGVVTHSLTNQDVALFKGREFDGGGLEEEEEEEDGGGEDDDDDPDIIVRAGSGIVHRSPRIEGTGIVRLVLVLDIPSDFHEEEEEEDMEDSGDDGEEEEQERLR